MINQSEIIKFDENVIEITTVKEITMPSTENYNNYEEIFLSINGLPRRTVGTCSLQSQIRLLYLAGFRESAQD